MSGVQYVFGYGSLVATRDGHVTQLRDQSGAGASQWTSARPAGLPSPTSAPDGSRPAVFVAFLDVAPAPGASVSGVCSPVDLNALTRLDERERNYERRDVTALLADPPGPTWAYVGVRRPAASAWPAAWRPRRPSSPTTTCAWSATASGHSPRWTPATCPCARYGASTSSPASLRKQRVQRRALVLVSGATAPAGDSSTTPRARSSAASRPASGEMARLRRSLGWGRRSASPPSSSSSILDHRARVDHRAADELLLRGAGPGVEQGQQPKWAAAGRAGQAAANRCASGVRSTRAGTRSHSRVAPAAVDPAIGAANPT